MNLNTLVKVRYLVDFENGLFETVEVPLEYVIANPIGAKPEDFIGPLIEAVREHLGLPPSCAGINHRHFSENN